MATVIGVGRSIHRKRPETLWSPQEIASQNARSKQLVPAAPFIHWNVFYEQEVFKPSHSILSDRYQQNFHLLLIVCAILLFSRDSLQRQKSFINSAKEMKVEQLFSSSDNHFGLRRHRSNVCGVVIHTHLAGCIFRSVRHFMEMLLSNCSSVPSFFV